MCGLSLFFSMSRPSHLVLLAFFLCSLGPFHRFLDRSFPLLKLFFELVHWTDAVPGPLLYYLLLVGTAFSVFFTAVFFAISFQMMRNFFLANPDVMLATRYRISIRRVSRLGVNVLLQHWP